MPLPRSVLIIRLSAIGDVVHALPLLEALRARLPDARIGWLAEELSAPLLQGHPHLDVVYTIPKKKWRGRMVRAFRPEIAPFFREIREDGWDATIDLQGITKSGAAAWACGASRRVGFRGTNSREANAFFQTHRVRPRPEDRHVVQQNLRLLEGLGLKVPATPPRGQLPIGEEETAAMEERLRAAGWSGERLLGVNAGAGFPSKLWGADRYAALSRRLCTRTGFQPLIFWGPGEEALRDRLRGLLEATGAIAAPRTSVRESAAMTALCSLFLSGDTGPAHLAGVLRVPVITVFGATDGARNCPWPAYGSGAAGVYVQRRDLPCVPCRKRRCPLGGDAHLACLKDLSPEDVYTEVEPWLRRRFPVRHG